MPPPTKRPAGDDDGSDSPAAAASSAGAASSASTASDEYAAKRMRLQRRAEAAAPPAGPAGFRMERVRVLTKRAAPLAKGDCIVYWMSRDQRAHHNHAMLYARHLAQEHHLPLVVVFNLVPRFLEATMRHYDFMLRGLEEVEADLRALHIPFHLLTGQPAQTVPAFVEQQRVAALVTDFAPLRVPLGWTADVAQKLDKLGGGGGVPLLQVDAQNVVPVWVASDKQEYAARTIRPKITSWLPTFSGAYPELRANPTGTALPAATNWAQVRDTVEVDRSVGPVDWCKPGHKAGLAMLDEFCRERLKLFATKRNDPTVHALSNLSPWIHFGHISVQHVIHHIRENFGKQHSESVKVYVEEAVVRRELAENFCYYNPLYDSLAGAYQWARDSLEKHASDPREHVYTQEQLEKAQTHDDLWNAAQTQMVVEGKMHGWLRMYWAKKILEWTPSPQEALRIAIYLNDRYQMDGRSPNGYVGCMWSIAGIHDQGWGERPIFGKIRFMNYAGAKRKFDVKAFVQRYSKKAGSLDAFLSKGGAAAGKASKK